MNEPDIRDVRNVTTASPIVTAKTPVGDPTNGISPNRLQATMKKKRLQRTGVTLSAK